MAWDDAPPTEAELKSSKPAWDSAPPSAEELKDSSGSILSTIGKGLEWVGEKYDRYVTAPTRAAIMEEMNQGFQGKPISAFARQFGEDPSKAPSGTQIAEKMGISNDPRLLSSLETGGSPEEAMFQAAFEGAKGKPIEGEMTMPSGPLDPSQLTPANAAGAGISAFADPLLVAPVGKIAKGGAKLIGKGISGTTELAGKALDTVAGTTDLITGTEAAGKAYRGAGRMIDSAANVGEAANLALKKVFSPKIAEDFGELAKIAEKNGIDPALLPESVEFGPGSFIERAARARREGPIGEKYLEQFNQAYDQVQGALEKRIGQISGTAAPVSAPEAGLVLRKGFDEAIKDFWNSIELTHDSVVSKYAPGLYVDRGELQKVNSVINGIEKFAKGRLQRGITAEARSQAQELLNAVEAFRAGNGSYKQTVEALRDIGEAAFGTTNYPGKIPSDTKKLRDLYFSIDEALINTVEKHVSPEMAAELKANNQAISRLFEQQNQVGYVLADKALAPEAAFKKLIMNGDTDQLATLQKMLTPETMQKMKGAFIESLIKREPDGSFSLKTLFNAMRNKQTQMSMLFSPKEITEIGELLRLGERLGNPVMSTSGTGASNVFHHILDSLKSGVANDTMIENLKAKARATPALPPPPESSRAPLWYLAKGAQAIESTGEVSSSQIAKKEDRNPERGVAGASGFNIDEALRKTPGAFGKYSKQLQEAAARGGNALSATHFVLQQTDPEYRQKIKDVENAAKEGWQ